ncbi:unnamed protein product [Strongylus vulgaris]|uniref:Ezrin/radixin/moesin C-terminal domain-containing protein n=1 Tax=Strongylus vulgaris TaxID=40348 RepID=A0A3P7KVI0_STRVU|nr:unnamed protein product [Strongylus vulgaris]
MRMERKAREAELYAQRISMSLADVNAKPHYASHALITEPTIWPLSNLGLQGTLSHHQLMISGGSQEGDRSTITDRQQILQSQHHSVPQSAAPIYRAIPNMAQMMHAPPPPDPSVNQRLEFHNLRSELEKSRHDFSEKARLFKERLDDFRNEIDALKREDRQTEHDVIHQHNVHNGFDKFTTLRMASKPTVIFCFAFTSFCCSALNKKDFFLT